MRIHKEGSRIILTVIITFTAIVAAVFFISGHNMLYTYVVATLGAILSLGTLLFFRVPVRNTEQSDRRIYSGADGRVVVIEEVQESEFFNDKRIQVSVFMSVTNVHVNFAPCAGKVKFFKYHPGKHLFAWLPKSSKENERTSLVIENEHVGSVMMHQVAGAFARRIVCFPKAGENLKQGQEIGIIKFGSRIDLFLPLHSEIKVKLNQHVKGGETVIAEIPGVF